MSGGEKLGTILFTLYKYIQLFLFPHPLNHDYYPYEIPLLSFGDIRVLGSLLLYGVITYFAIRGIRRKSVVSYALLHYLATLSIVSNIVINLGTFMNERFVYMASLGLSILVAYLISEKLAKWKGQTGIIAASVLAAMLLLGYSWKTLDRVPDWKDALALNTSATEHGSNSARANSFMATALYNQGLELKSSGQNVIHLFQEGYDYAEKAVRIHPSYQNGNLMKAGLAAEIHKYDNNESLLLQRFSEVMAKRPDIGFLNEYLDYYEPRARDVKALLDWYAKTAIEDVLIRAKKPKWALHYLNRGYQLDKSNVKILEGISLVYGRLGDQAKSETFRVMAENARR